MSDDLDKTKNIKNFGGVWRKTFESVMRGQIADKGIKGVFSDVADAYTRAKKEENEVRLTELYRTWYKLDTWLIYEEAVPLSLGIAPRDMLLTEYFNPIRGNWPETAGDIP